MLLLISIEGFSIMGFLPPGINVSRYAKYEPIERLVERSIRYVDVSTLGYNFRFVTRKINIFTPFT